MPGDAGQLRGDRGVQSPSLAEGQRDGQAATTPNASAQEELPTAPDGQEAEKAQLTSGPGQHELRPEGGVHLQLSSIFRYSKTQTRLR